jgi:hypothetical protein
MPASQTINAKTILVLAAVAIVVSVVVTLIQTLILGKANVAITGGVVVPTVVALALSARRKRSS